MITATGKWKLFRWNRSCINLLGAGCAILAIWWTMQSNQKWICWKRNYHILLALQLNLHFWKFLGAHNVFLGRGPSVPLSLLIVAIYLLSIYTCFYVYIHMYECWFNLASNFVQIFQLHALSIFYAGLIFAVEILICFKIICGFYWGCWKVWLANVLKALNVYTLLYISWICVKIYKPICDIYYKQKNFVLGNFSNFFPLIKWNLRKKVLVIRVFIQKLC